MKHIILGTAGHVDHGKTSLVKAITGVDTDRLKEEKERGITIELGFASLPLKNGDALGVVDVPGHEKFVKHMVAGATGIDMVLLVIAADEGVMPQTSEHLDICTLLGIKTGIIALTKIDMVDPDWLSLVQDDIREFMKTTFLADAPLIPVSVVTGQGLAELTAAIEEMASRIGERRDSGLFRIPVDRVFTMKGFGSVVTGTLVSGSVNVGDTVEVLPRGIHAKVRGIQVHNEPQECAEAGQRTAINLQGVDRAALERGDVVAHPGIFESSQRLDVRLEYLGGAGRVLKNRALTRFHAGTSEIMARVVLIDREELQPGQKVFAQLLLEDPVVAMGRDRFVIRSYSPIRTVGGGEILDPDAIKQKKTKDRFSVELEMLMSGTDTERVAVILGRTGIGGITPARLAVRTGIPLGDLTRALKDMAEKKTVITIDREEMRVVPFAAYQGLKEEILREIGLYHQRFPLKEGVSKEELRTTAGQEIESRLFNMALKELENEKKIHGDREHVRLAAHRVDLKGNLGDLGGRIEKIYRDAQLAPPSVKEVLETLGGKKAEIQSVLGVLLNEGVLVKVTEELYFHGEPMNKLREDYTAALAREGKATPATFKDLTGLSRKYIIPLMEYFDATKLTIRVGDHRTLRERK
ncbi:MAG TPA: selenocysteine-specific translation elongation factor [Syntrophales bacterium]|nr:selenocysteine-specific translation elongation factor [Syntrophales bacterium]